MYEKTETHTHRENCPEREKIGESGVKGQRGKVKKKRWREEENAGGVIDGEERQEKPV